MRTRLKLNGKWYLMDKETAKVFQDIVPQAVKTRDFSAAWSVLELGLKSGRIEESTLNWDEADEIAESHPEDIQAAADMYDRLMGK